MNVRSAEAGTAPDEQKVAALMAEVDRLVGERRDAEAQRLLGEAAAILPDHPLIRRPRGPCLSAPLLHRRPS
jgi:hypothetical protein